MRPAFARIFPHCICCMLLPFGLFWLPRICVCLSMNAPFVRVCLRLALSVPDLDGMLTGWLACSQVLIE